MNNEYKALYESVSNEFNIGTFEDFQSRMQSPEDRKSFYDKLSENGFSLGDYNQYENRLKKKEESQEPFQFGVSDTELLSPSQETKESTEDVAVDRSATVGEWFGNIWNGLSEGVTDFLYSAAESTGLTDKNILSFIEQKKEEYPDLFEAYQKSLSNTAIQENFTGDKAKELAARTAYSQYWESDPTIENEVVPFIRGERREEAVKKTGVEIPEEIKRDLDDQFWNSSLKGLMSSLPAMVASAPTGGGSFIVQSYYTREEEIAKLLSENPDLEMTESQKESYKVTGALVEGIIEKVGLSGALKGSPALTKFVTAGVINKALKGSKNVTKETFDRYVNESVQQVVKRVGGGTLAEAETGALQQLSDDALKAVVNSAKGQEFFEPKPLINVFKDAVYAGAQEAVGGGVISSVSLLGTSSNEKKLKDIKNEINDLKKKRDASETEEEKTIIDDVITDLTEEQEVERNISFEFYSKFSEEDINEVQSLNGQIRDVADKYNIAKSETLKTKYKQEIDELRSRKQELENKYSETPTRYIRDGKEVSKSEFVDMINKATPEEMSTGQWGVENDTEVEQLLASRMPKVDTKEEAAVPSTEVVETEVLENLNEIELGENETIIENREVIVKGEKVNFTIIEQTSEKDGVKTTKYQSNRSNKSSDQRSNSSVSPETALNENEEINLEENGLEDIDGSSTEVTKVFEVREDANGTKVAVVEFMVTYEDGTIDFLRGTVKIKQKAKEAAVKAEPVAEPSKEEAQADRDVQKIEPEIILKNIEDQVINYKDPVSEDIIEGALIKDGQRAVVESGSRLIDIGNFEELQNTPISELGIEIQLTPDVQVAGKTISIRGSQYVSTSEKLSDSFNYSDDGDIASVSLETKDGKTRTFRGAVAQELVYQNWLQENASTPEQITKAESELKNLIEQDEEASKILSEPVKKAKQPEPVSKDADIKEARTEEVEIILLDEQGARKKLTQTALSDPRNIQKGKMTVEYSDKGLTFKTKSDTGRMKENGGELFVSNKEIESIPNINKYEKGTKEYAFQVAGVIGVADQYKGDPIKLMKDSFVKPQDIGKEGTPSAKRFTPAQGAKLSKMVDNFNRIIKRIGASPVKIVFVNSPAEFKQYYEYTTGSKKETLSKASYLPLQKEIIVDLSKADMTTLAHEMLHAYVSAIKLDRKKVTLFTNIIEAELLKGSDAEVKLAKELADFRNEYIKQNVYGKGRTKEDAIIAEEFLAEYVGMMSAYADELSPAKQVSFADKIRAAVVKFLAKIGVVDKSLTVKIQNREDALNFINGFVDALQGRTEVTAAPEVQESEPIAREQIDAVKIISLDTPKQKAKKEAVAEVLNGFAESQLVPNSSEQDLVSRFLNNIFEESLYTLKKGPRESGMTWYIEDITEFENKMTVLLPELADPNQMKLFKQVLAITSSGTNPNQNLQTAYTLWVRSNGATVNFAKNWGEDKISFITNKGVPLGTGIVVRETKAKYIVQKVNALGDLETFKNGQPKLFEAKKSTLKAGYPKPAGFTARGSIVAQQLSKIEQVYKDVNGDINKLIEFFEKPQPVSELRKYNKGLPDVDGNVRKQAVGKRNGAFIFGEKIGAFYQNMIGIGDTITMDLWWSRTWNRYMGTMLSTVDNKQVIQETPRTDRERDIMRKSVTLAANKLGLDVSELQAVIWYFEQELWTKAGNVSPSFSYVTAVESLNSKIEADEQTQKRFSEAGADLTAAEKRRQDAIARANNIIAEGGIQGDIARDQIDWQPSLFGKGKVNPAIVNRTTDVQEAAVDLLQGKITNAEYQETVRITQPIEAITKFFLPASTKDMQDALQKNKAELLNSPVKDGEEVGLRLDIPAYKDKNIWIVSVHGKGKSGKSIGYGSVAQATDVIFGSNPKVAAFIASGQNMDTLKKQDKTTIARMLGKWKNFEGKTKEEKDASAVKKVEEIVKIESSYPGAGRKGSPWRQIGMNPFRHSYFYDRRTGKPVVSAKEVVQIGGLVYAKDVEYADWSDDQFTVDGYKDADGQPVRFQLDTDELTKIKDKAYAEIEKGKISAPLYKKTWYQSAYNYLLRTELESKIVKLQEKKGSRVEESKKQAKEIAARIKKYAKTPKALELANEYLTSENKKNAKEAILKLPKGQQLLNNLRIARAFIDNISNELIKDPAFDGLSDDLRLAVQDNLSTYLRTQYRFFTDKRYNIDKRRKPAIDAQADQLLAREIGLLSVMGLSPLDISTEIAKRQDGIKKEAEQMIDGYISDLNYVKYQPSKGGAGIKMPSAAFKRKKDLPDYIEQLLGKEKDPIKKFAQTSEALANILYKGRMIDGIIDIVGENSNYILDVEPSSPKDKQYSKVNDPYSKLNGKWVHNEIMDMVNQKSLYSSDNPFLQSYYNLVRLSRKSKVIWNLPSSYRKNLTGGWFFVLTNGVINPSFSVDFLRRTKRMFNVRGEKFQIDEETKRLAAIAADKGLFGASIDANLIGFSQATYQLGLDGDENAYVERLKKVFNITSDSLSAVDSWLQEKYSSIDDYTKLIIFRSEIQTYSKKLYGKEYTELNENQKDNVHEEAAERVKQSTPTFSRLPKWFNKIAALPVIAPFISFTMESIRSYSMNVANGASDIKKSQDSSLNDVQKKAYLQAGLRRLAGAGAALSLRYAIVKVMTQFFLDDEDEELADDARKLRPDWMSGHSIIPRSIDKDGNVKVYNYSTEDPYNDVSNILEGPGSWGEFIGGFVGPDIAADVIMNLIKNKDIYGNSISDYSDSKINQTLDLLKYGVDKIAIPPTLSSTYRNAWLESDLPTSEKPMEFFKTLGERSIIRDYKYNIISSLYQSVNKISETRKSYLDYDNPTKRKRQLDDIRGQYDAIVAIAIAKNNLDLVRRADKAIKNLDDYDQAYLLYESK